jgi:hypothetical protein
MVQKFTCGVIEGPEFEDPQLHHMETSGPSITPHGNICILNYTTRELLSSQLHHTGVIEGPEVLMGCK